MIACLDVQYGQDTAHAAGVVFHDWADAAPVVEKVVTVTKVLPYVPGSFYLRELPCLLAVLKELPPVEIVVIDAYVWLVGGKPGLGAYLHAALGQKVTVIGVAKSLFCYPGNLEVKRGKSGKSLYVTAAGVEAEQAAEWIRGMHGEFRMPTMIRRADQLARGVGCSQG